MNTIHSCHVRISGMTCIWCQDRIETLLKSSAGIREIQVSYQKAEASFVYDSTQITYPEIVSMIRDAGYDIRKDGPQDAVTRRLLSLGAVAGLLILLQTSGLLNRLVPSALADSRMGYGALFLTGLLTSVHCLAMCGGVSLSQSLPQDKKASFRSTGLYNAGRVLSYSLTGLILGTTGYFISGSAGLEIPLLLQGLFKIIAGILLAVMGIRMMDIIPALRKFRIPLPPSAARTVGKAAAKSRTPLMIGFLNGFMPCAPLQAMWLVAFSSGSPVRGMLSMLLFSLGTVPLMIGFGAFVTAAGRKFTHAVQSAGAVLITVMGIAMLMQGNSLSGMLSDDILYTLLMGAAILLVCLPLRKRAVRYAVLFLALLLSAGIRGVIRNPTATAGTQNTAGIVDGVQMVSSTLQAGSYPEITIMRGIPVQWTILAEKNSINGCNNTIISNDFQFRYTFHEGENLISFTPEQAGDYTYVCWMGMIKGIIHVIDQT